MSSPTVPAPEPPNIYLLAAHPHWRDSRVNRLLVRAARGIEGVEVKDLYDSYPDFAIDVEAEQAKLARADLVVLMHPIHWYSMPPLQKLWLDEVLTYGWAYGPGGTALAGKDLWLVATTGGPEESYHPQSYNRYFFDAFLPPYEQTGVLCGLRFLPPLILHGARSATDAEVQTHVQTFAERLGSFPNWPEIDALGACPACVVPPTDRPREDEDAGAVSRAFGKLLSSGAASLASTPESA